MNQADSLFPCVSDFADHLHKLRRNRLAAKIPGRSKRVRLSRDQRRIILEKSGGRCHICGGRLSDKWVANHIHAHTHGGNHSLDNYLAAHRVCNQARWFYGAEEFQWIMKMGVYFRTQLEEIGSPDAVCLARRFLEHEARRDSRRKKRPLKNEAVEPHGSLLAETNIRPSQAAIQKPDPERKPDLD